MGTGLKTGGEKICRREGGKLGLPQGSVEVVVYRRSRERVDRPLQTVCPTMGMRLEEMEVWKNSEAHLLGPLISEET